MTLLGAHVHTVARLSAFLSETKKLKKKRSHLHVAINVVKMQTLINISSCDKMSMAIMSTQSGLQAVNPFDSKRRNAIAVDYAAVLDYNVIERQQ